MKRLLFSALLATFAASCTEEPSLGTTIQEATVCVTDPLASAPAPYPRVQYTANTVLPNSTVNQTWLLLPFLYHYSNNTLVVDTWGLYLVDPALRKVVWAADVPPAQLANASVAYSLRPGLHGGLPRPPEPPICKKPACPIGDGTLQMRWEMADGLIGIDARLRAAMP